MFHCPFLPRRQESRVTKRAARVHLLLILPELALRSPSQEQSHSPPVRPPTSSVQCPFTCGEMMQMCSIDRATNMWRWRDVALRLLTTLIRSADIPHGGACLCFQRLMNNIPSVPDNWMVY